MRPSKAIEPAVGNLADIVADVILLIDGGGKVLAGNHQAGLVLGRDPVGLSLEEVFGPEVLAAHRAVLDAAGLGTREFEAPLLVAAEEPVGFLWVVSPAGDDRLALCGREMTHVYGLDLIRRLTEDLQERQRHLEVVSEINRALARTLDIERIDALVAREICRLLPLDFLQVAVSATSSELCDVRILQPDGTVVSESHDRPWAGSAVEDPYRQRRPVIRRAHDFAADGLGKLGVVSALDMPVVLDDRSLGVLTFASLRPDAYKVFDPVVVAPIVGQYAVALANGRLVRSLEEANRIKREIIQITSHELNTPLTVIKGMSAVLAAGSAGISQAQLEMLLKSIDQQADRLIKLVADLLMVSQIEAGRIDLYLTSVDLGTLVRDTSMSVRRLHSGRDCVVVVESAIFLRQDANKLIRCLTNLMSNAFKFSPPDSAVEVTVRPGAEGWEVRIFNVDEGMTADEMQGIFEKFGRLARHQNSHEGAGLGLYTTKRLSKRLGGDVRVESEKGRGTTFTLIVPDLERLA